MTGDGAELTSLIGLDREQLTALVESYGEKPFRARQLWHLT